jgi:hypothetical protein
VELWQEFEARQSAEARFARAMDRLMPILLNLNRQGQSWRENGVSKQQVVSMAASKVSDGCPLAGEWLLQALDRAEEQGFSAPETEPAGKNHFQYNVFGMTGLVDRVGCAENACQPAQQWAVCLPAGCSSCGCVVVVVAFSPYLSRHFP